MLGNGDITSASSSSSSSSSSESESKCDVQPLEGDLLMVRRLMGNVCKDRMKLKGRTFFILGAWSWENMFSLRQTCVGINIRGGSSLSTSFF